MKKIIIALLCLLTACGLFAQSKDALSITRPNIIVILADDLGYGDLRSYGAPFQTPHLDKLAREGMRFTHFYAQPQCSPSRAALLTGCYPQRVGIPWVVGPQGPAWTEDKYFVGLNPEEQTLPELLKDKGYVTACIGKWHLGHHDQHLPTRHGFDVYFGLPYSNDMHPGNSPEWPDLPLLSGEKVVEKNPDQTRLTQRFTQKAVAFIEQNQSKPFFLYLAHAMPHVPIYVSDKFKGKSGRGLYADVIQETDWSVGELMKALKKYKLDKNTLIVFTSDNGPWVRYGNHAGSAAGLREGKATTFEGGVRVPMIARWPGHIPAGTTNREVAALFDLLPTIARLLDIPLPGKPIDGRSILPALLGQAASGEERIHYYYQVHELQAVRRGKWKLHLPHTYEHVTEAGVDGEKGKVTMRQAELSLFDLEADPGEQHNQAAAFPQVVKELQELGEAFHTRLARESRPAAFAR